MTKKKKVKDEDGYLGMYTVRTCIHTHTDRITSHQGGSRVGVLFRR